MWVFREPEESDFGKEFLTFTLGALGGLALGAYLSRSLTPERATRLGDELRQRARSLAVRLRPARLRRGTLEQTELTALEDAVLDAFLADAILGGRGIDIGAISAGIVELSGAVWTPDEVDRAVRVAHAVPGVKTVVNRLETEDEMRRAERARRRSESGEDRFAGFGQVEGRGGGMGRRRQGGASDPDRPDDKQDIAAAELADADAEQWAAEGFSTVSPPTTERPGGGKRGRTRYREDQLDNQDPHGKHAPVTLDAQPQAFNTGSRVGEGLKPGIELALEAADLPVKPHSD